MISLGIHKMHVTDSHNNTGTVPLESESFRLSSVYLSLVNNSGPKENTAHIHFLIQMSIVSKC